MWGGAEDLRFKEGKDVVLGLRPRNDCIASVDATSFSRFTAGTRLTDREIAYPKATQFSIVCLITVVKADQPHGESADRRLVFSSRLRTEDTLLLLTVQSHCDAR